MISPSTFKHNSNLNLNANKTDFDVIRWMQTNRAKRKTAALRVFWMVSTLAGTHTLSGRHFPPWTNRTCHLLSSWTRAMRKTGPVPHFIMRELLPLKWCDTHAVDCMHVQPASVRMFAQWQCKQASTWVTLSRTILQASVCNLCPEINFMTYHCVRSHMHTPNTALYFKYFTRKDIEMINSVPCNKIFPS